MWVSNIPSNVTTNAEQVMVPITQLVTVNYDPSVDAISIRVRPGETRYVIEGSGNFVIFADDNGVWGIDLEVKEWDRGYGEVLSTLRRMSVKGAW